MHHPNEDKWQQMHAVVRQHSLFTQSNVLPSKTKLFLGRLLAENILVMLLQIIGLKMSTVGSDAFPVWFATGTAIAFFFLRGLSVAPGIGIGSVIACVTAGATWSVSLISGAILAGQGMALLYLSYQLKIPTLLFAQTQSWLRFVLLSGWMTLITSSLLMLLWDQPRDAVLIAWLANWNGVLILSTAIIAWDAYFSQSYLIHTVSRAYLAAIYLLLILLSGWVVLYPTIAAACLLVLYTGWIGRKLGWCGVIVALLLTVFLFIVLLKQEHLVFIDEVLLVQALLGLTMALKGSYYEEMVGSIAS